MDDVSVEELELLGFFGVEPKRLDLSVPWPYNDFLYEVKQGEMSLTFAVAPAYRDVRIIWKSGSVSLYELNAVGVEDVKYHNDSGRETIEVAISRRNKLWLRILPNISISHEATEREA
jgi:hypothetical protein